MSGLDRYITVGSKQLRCGYTTGACAAAAARGAADLLLAGLLPGAVHMELPAGVVAELELLDSSQGDGWAQCAVRKDAGDDPDVTDGLLVYARVERSSEPGVRICGGEGVGRVTRPGLDQPVGEAAINSVPRAMIAEQVQAAADAVGSASELGFLVTVSVPGGAEVAQRTFNPRLGIEGGISIIGTTGIVRPMSEEAIVESVRLEMRQRHAEGLRHLVLVPGNYGLDFAEGLGVDLGRVVQCSNYIGEAVDFAVQLGFESLLVVGHIGKMAKVAAGVMNTHSRVADARMETIAAHAALSGASRDVVACVMDAVTTDAALDVLAAAGLLDAAMSSLVQRVGFHLRKRAGNDLPVEAIVFSKVRGLLGQTECAADFARRSA